MTTKFVTCIYNNINGTVYGGRLNRNDVYKFSLNSISETGIPITCFTSSMDITELLKYFGDYKKNNTIQFKIDELNTLPFHDAIARIKGSNTQYNINSWESRSPHIMYGKFLWMLSELQHSAPDDYVYWIDAGLSHGGILPRKFTESFIHENDYPPVIHDMYFKEFMNRHELIFNQKLSHNLNSYTGDKFLLIACNHPQHAESKYNNNPCGVYPVGGLFGGKKSIIEPIIYECMNLVYQFLNNEILIQEEVILEIVACKNMHNFNIFTFDTWYHDDWGDHYKDMKCFYKFFEDIRCT